MWLPALKQIIGLFDVKLVRECSHDTALQMYILRMWLGYWSEHHGSLCKPYDHWNTDKTTQNMLIWCDLHSSTLQRVEQTRLKGSNFFHDITWKLESNIEYFQVVSSPFAQCMLEPQLDGWMNILYVKICPHPLDLKHKPHGACSVYEQLTMVP